MRRLRTDEADHITFTGFDHYTLGQHDMPPPPSEGTEFDKPLFGHEFYDESDLIHMSCEHDPRFFYLTVLPTHDASQPVLFYGCDPLKMFPNNLTDLLLIS